MSASEALIEGQQAGALLLPPSLNKYPPGTVEHGEWERGRLAASAKLVSTRCRYHDGPCTCGGRGLCLDVA